MGTADKTAPRGFAGLSELVSAEDVSHAQICDDTGGHTEDAATSGTRHNPSTTAPETAVLSSTAATGSGTQECSPPINASKRGAGPRTISAVALSVLALVAVAMHFEKPPPSNASPSVAGPAEASGAQSDLPPTVDIAQAMDPVPDVKPTAVETEMFERHLFKLQGTDGSVVEIEAPKGTSDAALAAFATSLWESPDSYGPEDRPPTAEGLHLSVEQTRYCLSQTVRLEAWRDVVKTELKDSVDTFNDAISDFNGRCADAVLDPGSLVELRAALQVHRGVLEEDGRRHMGPRQSSAPPTYVTISSRIENTPAQVAPSRCVDSLKPDNCFALERRVTQLTAERGAGSQ